MNVKRCRGLILPVLAALLIPSAPGMASTQSHTASVNIRVCNRVHEAAMVAVSYIDPATDDWVTRGWFEVGAGTCAFIARTTNLRFYAVAGPKSHTGGWWEGDFGICTESASFTYRGRGGGTCSSWQRLRQFVQLDAVGDGDYTWNLDP